MRERSRYETQEWGYEQVCERGTGLGGTVTGGTGEQDAQVQQR